MANSVKSVESAGTKSADKEALLNVDLAYEGKVVRKLDLCLIPLMTMFYLLSFLDRANIGNARVAGLQKDLKLTDIQYQICLTVLYVPYICAELPANLLMRKIGPNILMPTILTMWGVLCMLQGTVKNFSGLVAIRFFLGLVEGPMFPGIVLYLSGFYTRKELSLRIAMFFSASSLAGAFSGLLAAAILNMDGVQGKPGWSWIFLLEGLFTVVFGLVSYFLVPSTPYDVRFLSPEEREIIAKRLLRDRPTTGPIDTFSPKQMLLSLTSPHVLLVFIALFMNGTTLFGLALFLPTIVNQLGFSPTRTQLVSVGPFATAFIVMLLSAFFSDRFKNRAVFAAVNAAVAMIGFAVFLGSQSHAVSYGSLFLSVPGTYAMAPILSTWIANNSEPHYRRATSVALGFIATNAGGILSTWSFPSSEAPRFRRATIMDLSFSACIAAIAIVNAIYISHKNRSKQAKRQELLSPYVSEKVPDGANTAWVELGDQHPDFEYAL